MKRSNLSLAAVLTVACFGHCLADCKSCQSTSCSNIHVCYNCETRMNSDCLQTYSGVDKDTCRTHLTTSSNKKASYEQATQTCQLSMTSCKIKHSPSIDVLFMKTCDTGCSNYTITKDNDQAVVGGSPDTYGEVSSPECLSKCLPPSQDCTVSFVSNGDTGDCYVYTTSCGGSCTTVASTGWRVMKVTCNGVACPALSDPPNGVADTSAGTSSGDQATYTCDIGYILFGSSVTTCGSDGNWDNSSPTCTPIDCGSLNNTTEGTVAYSSTTYGSQANYDCNTGYSISGSSMRTCGSDGNWDSSAPTCSLVDCGSLSNPSDGTVSFSLTTYGSEANYDCNTGYVLSGSSVITCGSDGNWDSSAPTCSRVDCGSLSNPSEGTVSFSLTTYGSEANYDCNTGYVLSGSSVITCGSDGNWDSSAPTCSLVDCGSLSNPSDGTVSFSLTTYGSEANYDCNTGYVLSGSSVITCGLDGNWDSSAPTCSLVDCGSLSNPSDGTVSFSLTTHGSQANYDCNTGYVLSGLDVRTCGLDGNWDSSAPTCSLVDCGSLSNPTDGTVLFTLTTYGSEANYDCNTGYVLSGSSVRTCGLDGNWDSSAPTCSLVDCGSLSNPSDGTVSFTLTTYGSQANYDCNTGYSISVSSVRTCGSDGTWDNSAPTCSLVDCGSLSNPPDGIVSFTLTTYGSQANYDCDIGFTLSGSSLTTCGSDGTWDNSAPTCSPVDCGSLSNPTDGIVSFTLTIYGSQANYDCDIGFTLSGSSLTTCGSDGNWDNAVTTCTPVDCGLLTNPIFGSVTYTNTTYGSQANYTCITGYSLTGSNSKSCLSNGTWELMEPECVSTDCGLLTDPANGSVHTPAGTTFGKTDTFSCDSGYALSHVEPRICQSTSSWSGTSPTCNLAGTTTTTTKADPLPKKLYIMPCICYTNKTFVNMTQEEIIQQLIADTKIDTKNTSLSHYKLKSRSDPRMSSKMIGMVAIVILSVIGGLILFCDILTIRDRMRQV